MSEEKSITANDVINELKRLQVEYGNLETVKSADDELAVSDAWPIYNEKRNRIEF